MIRYLFTPEGEAALAATMAAQPLLAFDFDGTLAPIVARPDAAGVPQPVTRRLERLAALLPVAIVTGRSVADVRARLAFAPRFIVGSHGAEDPDDPGGAGVAIFDGLRARLRERAAELQRDGVIVEDKGHSMALHYRLARDRDRARTTIEDALADLGPELTAYGGKRVVNVVASDAPDKAEAVARLVARCGARAAVFAGDDVNDEPVFARAEPHWLTVRVGRDDPNTQAKFCIDSAAEMAILLDRMLVLASAPRA